jgi:two-component system CheB/CheR fusion protein
MADKQHKVYTKKMTGIRMNMNFTSADHGSARFVEAGLKPERDGRANSNILSEANRVVLGKYAPPGVIVDEDSQIIQFRGQTGPFLEPAPGEASLNLLKMAREGLLYELRSALKDARRTGVTTRREGLRIKYNGHILDVNIEVTPLLPANDQRHFLVVFEDISDQLQAADGKPSPPKGKGRPPARSPAKGNGQEQDGEVNRRVLRLQQELAASREYLQSIIQDLEAANEELQSANEEILSSNEELQSTNEELDTAKEELQSTNEELNTVNEELQERNGELSRANSDLVNLLSSVQIAVVMVTSDLRIRRFTPMAEHVLNLIPTDIGRPIGDIKPNIDLSDLESLILQAIDSVSPVERETRDRQGVRYLVRIRPYKSLENRIDGAVLALFDLDMARRFDAGPAGRPTLEGLLAVAREPMAALDGKANLLAVNKAFGQAFNITAEGAAGYPIYELAKGQWNIPQLHELLERTLPRQRRVTDVTIEHEFAGMGRVKLIINAQRVGGGEQGEFELVLLSINSVDGNPAGA